MKLSQKYKSGFKKKKKIKYNSRCVFILKLSNRDYICSERQRVTKKIT